MAKEQEPSQLSYQEMVESQLKKDRAEQAQKRDAWLQENPGGLRAQSREKITGHIQAAEFREPAQASEQERGGSLVSQWRQRTRAAVEELLEAVERQQLAEQRLANVLAETREAVEAKRKETISFLREGKDELARQSLRELGKVEEEERELQERVAESRKQEKRLSAEQSLTIQR